MRQKASDHQIRTCLEAVHTATVLFYYLLLAHYYSLQMSERLVEHDLRNDIYVVNLNVVVRFGNLVIR